MDEGAVDEVEQEGLVAVGLDDGEATGVGGEVVAAGAGGGVGGGVGEVSQSEEVEFVGASAQQVGGGQQDEVAGEEVEGEGVGAGGEGEVQAQLERPRWRGRGRARVERVAGGGRGVGVDRGGGGGDSEAVYTVAGAVEDPRSGAGGGDVMGGELEGERARRAAAL